MSLYIPSFSEILAVAESRGALCDAPHLWDGLVGAWPLQQAGGSTAFDVSGWGNHGTLTNMDPATDWVVTEKGRALRGDGTDNRVVHEMAAAYGPPWSFVISGAGESGQSQYAAIMNTAGLSHDRYYGFQIDFSGGSYRLYGDHAGGPTVIIDSYDTAAHTIAATYDGDTVRVYMDGTLRNTATNDVADWSTVYAYDLLCNRDALKFWKGCVTQFLAHRRILTDTEIQELYEDPPAMYRLRRRPFAATAATPSTIELPTIALAI